MAQIPPVKLNIHPSMFDLLLSVLERNAEAAPDTHTRSNAKDLMDKRMRFTRLYPDETGKQYASIRMYESEAAEMVWQLLCACGGAYEVTKEYSAELKGGSGQKGEAYD